MIHDLGLTGCPRSNPLSGKLDLPGSADQGSTHLSRLSVGEEEIAYPSPLPPIDEVVTIGLRTALLLYCMAHYG